MRLTEMNTEELVRYIEKWKKRQSSYKSGSRNWLKCHKRIKRAKTLHSKLTT